MALTRCSPQPDGRGGVRIWLATEFVNRLGGLRGPSESYSDVILRLAKAGPWPTEKPRAQTAKCTQNKPRGSGRRSTAGPTRSGPFWLALHAPDNQTRQISPVKPAESPRRPS
jgi:hypothetical protein